MTAKVKSYKQGIISQYECRSDTSLEVVPQFLPVRRFNIDLVEKIQETINIEEFLNFIRLRNLSIFLPEENFFTVFHVLIQSSRLSDFKVLTEYIKENADFMNDHNDLKQVFRDNIQEDEFELEREQIIHIYSNLQEVVCVDNQFDEEKDKEALENIKFISFKLKKVAEHVLDEIFS